MERRPYLFDQVMMTTSGVSHEIREQVIVLVFSKKYTVIWFGSEIYIMK